MKQKTNKKETNNSMIRYRHAMVDNDIVSAISDT